MRLQFGVTWNCLVPGEFHFSEIILIGCTALYTFCFITVTGHYDLLHHAAWILSAYIAWWQHIACQCTAWCCIAWRCMAWHRSLYPAMFADVDCDLTKGCIAKWQDSSWHHRTFPFDCVERHDISSFRGIHGLFFFGQDMEAIACMEARTFNVYIHTDNTLKHWGPGMAGPGDRPAKGLEWSAGSFWTPPLWSF